MLKKTGVHTAPPGHVVGMHYSRIHDTGPTGVAIHSGNHSFGSTPRTIVLSSIPSRGPTPMGYSNVHSQYHTARKLWAGIASRGPTTSAIIASGLMPLAFVACYETLIAKGKDKEGFKYILVRDRTYVQFDYIVG